MVGRGYLESTVMLRLLRVYNVEHTEARERQQLHVVLVLLTALLLLKAGFGYGSALAITVVAAILVGVVVERLVMRPIADSDWLTLFTATLGVYYIMHGLAGWIWGRDTKAFPVAFDSKPIEVLGIVVSEGHLINMGWAAAIGAVLFTFFRWTKQGVAMRAVTDDPETARLMGIPVRFIVLLTWGMAGFLGAFAGVLLAPIVYVSPQMMDEVLIKGYVAAVFGGRYSIPGAVIGALMIGVAENLAGGYLGSHYKTATAFAMIVVLLALRPQGLFGIQKRRDI